MLEIGALDLSKIYKTSSVGGGEPSQQVKREEVENALFGFGSEKTNISDDDMRKLEDEFLSAANGIGMSNPFAEKNSATDSLERDKENKIDEIKKVEDEVNTLVMDTQALSSNISGHNKEVQSGVKIGDENENSSSNINIFAQHSEATNKQELAKEKNQELGSLIKEAEDLDIEIASKSTCGEQGEVPDIKENSQKTDEVKKKEETSKEAENKGVKKTPQEILLEQVDLLSRLFPEMENKSGDIGDYQETHQRNILDLEATMQILRKQAEGFPAANPNGSYIQRQKSLFLGLTS